MNISLELQRVSNSTVAVIDEKLVSNAGAIILDDYIVAVDSGMRPDTARVFRKKLEDTFQRPVKFLFVTHYHADHVFSLAAFKDVTIFASTLVARNMKQSPDWSTEAFEARIKEDPSVKEWIDDVEFIIPTMSFHEQLDIVDGSKTIEFYHSGGHTSCSSYGYFPSEKILFAGDLIFAEQFPYAGDGACNPEHWIAALKKWLEWEIETIIPGHGPLVGKEEISKHLDLFLALKENTLKVIKAGSAAQDIEIPSVYPLEGESAEWFIERTRNRWYEYYMKGQ